MGRAAGVLDPPFGVGAGHGGDRSMSEWSQFGNAVLGSNYFITSGTRIETSREMLWHAQGT